MHATAELETRDLLVRYHAERGRAQRDLLVSRHMRLVLQIARSFEERCPGGMEDLAQVGTIGLIHAIDRYEPSMGRKFEAYAGTLITGEIRHYLRDQAHLVRLPRELVELRPTVRAVTAKLTQQEDRPPTLEELAQATGISEKKLEEVLELDRGSQVVSLDEETEDEGDTRPRYQLVDSRYRSFQLAAEDRIMLGQAMERMREVSREVIEFTFYQDLTQTEIAQQLGISQMQVSRRLRTAVDELWRLLNQRLW